MVFHGGIILFLFGFLVAVFSGTIGIATVGSILMVVGLVSIKYIPALEIE